MTDSEVQELRRRIAVMQHFLGGNEIESRSRSSTSWSVDAYPCWNWGLDDYRIRERRWRPATIEDAVRAISGEDVQARFRNFETQPWGAEGLLTGYRRYDKYPWIAVCDAYAFCEVQE